MNRILKISRLLLVAMIVWSIATSCSNEEENNVTISEYGVQANTCSLGTKTPKLTVYIETNDINPLNAGEYRFCDTTEEVVDHVILFASNIRGNATRAWLHHNPHQTYILNNVDSLVRPLQQKGIKVLLGLLGDHTGVGFANLTPNMIDSFAQQVADCVSSYGLDGVDIGNDYGRYDLAPAGLPTPSGTILGNLIIRLRQLMPEKMVTAFRYAYVTALDTTAMDRLDYMWPYYGCTLFPPQEFPASKWAKLSIHICCEGGSIPSTSSIQSCANNYSGFGAIMMFNMREWNASGIINSFAPRVWNGRTVCWTGVSHTKNY